MLGLPAQAVGVAWPSIRLTFALPLYYAGVISSLGSVVGILAAAGGGVFIGRFATSRLLAAGAVLLAVGSGLYAFSPVFAVFLAGVVPIGFGSGLINVSLNHYAAENCSSRHMNWLHCAWGVGATGGSFLMTFAVASGRWPLGFAAIALIQLAFAVYVFFSGRVFKTGVPSGENQTPEAFPEKEDDAGKAKKAAVLVLFFIYSVVEAGVGVWYSSLLVDVRGVDKETAAACLVVYWGAVTVGRFLIGVVSPVVGHMNILKFCLGGSLMAFPFLGIDNISVTVACLAFLGVSLSGMSPSMIYETPRLFGRQAARSLIGYQAAAASCGIVVLMPLLGMFLEKAGLSYLPGTLSAMMGICVVLVCGIYFTKRRTKVA